MKANRQKRPWDKVEWMVLVEWRRRYARWKLERCGCQGCVAWAETVQDWPIERFFVSAHNAICLKVLRYWRAHRAVLPV